MTLQQALRNDPFMVGFDRIFDRMHSLNTNTNQSNYPPYNIVKTDDNSYDIELAVAGFTEEQLDITVEDGILTIESTTSDDPDTIEYLHRGIGKRDFRRVFTLADTVVVRDAELINGILRVHLENVIPDEKKPRKISIGSAEAQLLTE